MEKLYKNKYLIGVYELDDDLVAICENGRKFADFMGITICNALTILKKLFDGETEHIRYKGKLCNVYFIDNDEEN